MAERKVTQAIVLAGGAGTRLRPLTLDRPKPMVLVGGKPFLEHLIVMLRENGITDILLLLGYLPEKVKEYFGDGSAFGVRIQYSIGTPEDETGTRLQNASPMLHDTFLLLYCDNYWPMNLQKMLEFYYEKGVSGMITVYNNRDGGAEYGSKHNVRVEDDSFVSFYGPFSEDPQLNAVDIGFFIMSKKSVLSLIPAGNFSFQDIVLPKLIARKELVGFRTDHPYYAITSPDRIPIIERFLTPRKIVFLDRDGTINKKMSPHEYIRRWEEFEFLPTVLKSFQVLTDAGYEIFIITNQRGIARGLMTEDNLQDIHKKMVAEIEKCGGRVSGIYYCPHGNDDNCFCRKPKPGMLFAAARDHALNLTKSVFIGDSENDRMAGEAAGCRMIMLNAGEALQEVITPIL